MEPASSDLLLTDLGPNRIAVISRVRELLDLSPAEAKHLTSALPLKIADGSLNEMHRLRGEFEALGATLEYGYTPYTPSPDPNSGGTKSGKPRIQPYWIFVYGTLKRRSRHPMARRLAQAARWVGAGRIAGRLYNLGRFPGLKKPRSSDDWVHGDVYDLSACPAFFDELDAYENAESPPPTPYVRQPATVELEDGRRRAVHVYRYQGEVSEDAFIASGSYEDNCDPA